METVKDKLVGVACYLAGVLFPIIFLTAEPYKSDGFVRFHSWQSIICFVLFGAWNVLLSLLPTTPVTSRFAGSLNLGFLIAWILLMIQAYRGGMFGLPVIGPLAKRLAA
jgi:uncharacterized membrane protein